MKKINFVNAKPKRKKRAIPIVISVVLLVIAITIISYLQINQWKTLAVIKERRLLHKKQVVSFDQELEEKNRLNTQNDQLSKKLSKINRVKNNPHHYFSLFTTINKSLTGIGQLEKLNLIKKKIDLTISCPSIKQATQFMRTINDLPSVASLDLISIQRETDTFFFKMNGIFNEKKKEVH